MMHLKQEAEVRRAYEAIDQKEAQEEERNQVVVGLHQGQVNDVINLIGRSVNRLESQSLRRQMRQYLLALMDADHGPARTPVIVPERTATFKT